MLNKKKIAELQQAQQAELVAMQVILDAAEKDNRPMTDDEIETFEAHSTAAGDFKTRWSQIEALETQMANAPVVKDINTDTEKESADRTGQPIVDKRIVIPAHVYRGGTLKAFRGPEAEERAYRAGRWFMALAGHKPSFQWCMDHGLQLIEAVHEETVNTAGGYLVPIEIDRDIIELVDAYGVFRTNARRSMMTSDVKTRPRRTGGLEAYFVGESEAGTESTKGWDNTSLTAKKIQVLSRITSELREDAIINVADDLVREIARAYAQKEDECGFKGTGAHVAYGGIKGISQKLEDLNGVNERGGTILATGNTFAEVTLVDLVDVIGILPSYAEKDAKIYCHKTFYNRVMVKLLTAAGANTMQSLEAGAQKMFLGYPVEFVNAMLSAEADSSYFMFFGDLWLAADFGDRRSMSIAFSDSATIGSQSVFERDQIAVRGTERFDINVHDVGSTSKAGPIVGLRFIT